MVAIAEHPPEIKSGTQATVIAPHEEAFYAVKLPSGELHRWFADSELEAVQSNTKYLQVGDLAKVVNNVGHPHEIAVGTIVKIAKVITKIPFYDVRLDNGKHHRWLAEFELANPI